METNIELVAVDLDGTLLTSGKAIGAATLDAIARVRAAGVQVMLATARPPRTTAPYQIELGLTEPMMNFNGALVWDTQTGRVVHHHPVPVNIARGIVKWARERYPDIRISAEVGDRWCTDFHDRVIEEDPDCPKPDMIGPALEWMTSPVTKLQLYGQPKWLKHVVWAIDVDIPNEVRTLHAGNHILQIMNRSVSKADALEALCGQTGTARENVMAIGDNANDASMIKWAGLGVCVGNGHPVSLQLADHVVADNEHDGVAQALHELIELGMTPNQW